MAEANVVDLPRGLGRPKGLPKTGGRKRGVRNKATKDVREIAQQYTRRAVRAAWSLATNAESEETRLRALQLILSYGHGRPANRSEIRDFESTSTTVSPVDNEPASSEAWEEIANILRPDRTEHEQT